MRFQVLGSGVIAVSMLVCSTSSFAAEKSLVERSLEAMALSEAWIKKHGEASTRKAASIVPKNAHKNTASQSVEIDGNWRGYSGTGCAYLRAWPVDADVGVNIEGKTIKTSMVFESAWGIKDFYQAVGALSDTRMIEFKMPFQEQPSATVYLGQDGDSVKVKITQSCTVHLERTDKVVIPKDFNPADGAKDATAS